jgi:hypothetical protein
MSWFSKHFIRHTYYGGTNAVQVTYLTTNSRKKCKFSGILVGHSVPWRWDYYAVSNLRGPNTHRTVDTSTTVFREIQNVLAGDQNLLTSATSRERTLTVLCSIIGLTPLSFEDTKTTHTYCSMQLQYTRD